MKREMFKIIVSSIILASLFLFEYDIHDKLNIIISNCGKHPVDCEFSLDKCYLEVHNFIQLNNTAFIESSNGSNHLNIKNEKSFKTYVTSFTRPYLIELIQNTTQNCLCCE